MNLFFPKKTFKIALLLFLLHSLAWQCRIWLAGCYSVKAYHQHQISNNIIQLGSRVYHDIPVSAGAECGRSTIHSKVIFGPVDGNWQNLNVFSLRIRFYCSMVKVLLLLLRDHEHELLGQFPGRDKIKIKKFNFIFIYFLQSSVGRYYAHIWICTSISLKLNRRNGLVVSPNRTIISSLLLEWIM